MRNNLNAISNTGAVQLSIVVPCFNEEAVLQEFHQRLQKALHNLNLLCEIIYVDDGSRDKTAELLEIFSQEAGVSAIRLSRNFGKEAAVSAGLDQARGDALILLDADLQDPPELIPEMVAAWQQGYDIVNMQRSSRAGDGPMKKFTAKLFYKTIARLNHRVYFPAEVSDFRLLGKEPLKVLRSLPERSRSTKAMVSWLGFRTIEVPYEREPRFAGSTKWNYLNLADLALESIIAVSRKPLRIFSYIAALFFITSLAYLIYSAVLGSVGSTAVLSLGLGLLVLGLAMLGEYIGVILEEVKQRPNFVISHIMGRAESATESPAVMQAYSIGERESGL